jgi:FdhE protein
VIIPANFPAILASLELEASKLDGGPIDPIVRELWHKRHAAGQPAITEDEFPVEVTAKLVISLLSKWENIPLTQELGENCVINYLADKEDTLPFQEHGISPERVKAYIHLACQKALSMAAAVVLGELTLTPSATNTCPICGGPPILGFYADENGQRNLVCGACLTQWKFKRIGCAFCGEERPEQLRVLAADELPNWIISLCLTCRGFLKTVDLRQQSTSRNWQTMIMESLPLDFAAVQWLTGADKKQ